jgi:hypothetical protein
MMFSSIAELFTKAASADVEHQLKIENTADAAPNHPSQSTVRCQHRGGLSQPVWDDRVAR